MPGWIESQRAALEQERGRSEIAEARYQCLGHYVDFMAGAADFADLFDARRSAEYNSATDSRSRNLMEAGALITGMITDLGKAATLRRILVGQRNNLVFDQQSQISERKVLAQLLRTIATVQSASLSTLDFAGLSELFAPARTMVTVAARSIADMEIELKPETRRTPAQTLSGERDVRLRHHHRPSTERPSHRP